ncbi:MAG: M3 family metallopeptidase [bacterium]
MKTKWDLTKIIPEEKIDEHTKKKVRAWKKFAKNYRKDKSFLKSPIALKKALDELCGLSILYEVCGVDNFYYRLAGDLNLEDTMIKQKEKELFDIVVQLGNELEFFSLELGKVKKEIQKIFLKSPELSTYRYFLKRLFELAKYDLPEESEKIFNLLSYSSWSSWIKMTEELINSEKVSVHDVHGKVHALSFEALISRMQDQNQKVREEANIKFNKILSKHKKPAEYEINSILDFKRVSDELRGYEYPEQSNFIGNDVEKDVVDKLVSEVSKRNDISHRYYELKARLMGKKKLEYYERNVPYGSVSKKYKFNEAYLLVEKTISKLDPEFHKIYRRYFDDGLVDVFPKVGKTNGGYCSTIMISKPSYVLLNYSNKINDVTTLAHEMGHVINYEIMKRVENPLYYGNSSLLLEVPSNLFEDLVTDEIENNLKNEERLGLIMERLNSSVSSVFRQIACYKFEGDLHRLFNIKRFVSEKEIGQLFSKRMKEYMGDGVNNPNYAKDWWIYWSHIRNFFYVYSYASGELISKYMKKMLRENNNWVNLFKKYMEAGESDSPVNILKLLGIEVKSGKVWAEGINEIEEQLNEAEQLAKKLGKI